jgi:hypothetical protein
MMPYFKDSEWKCQEKKFGGHAKQSASLVQIQLNPAKGIPAHVDDLIAVEVEDRPGQCSALLENLRSDHLT